MKPVKTLLLICGGVMATASLMGTIDFAKASKSGELKNLYKDGLAPLVEIPFLNKEQLLDPALPSLNSFSRAPIREQEYGESEYQAELEAANEENDKLYRDQRASAKAAAEIANRKKLQSSPEINLGSFNRGPLGNPVYVIPKDETIPNDK